MSYLIKKFREQKFPGRGSQAKCARLLGVTPQTWNQYEKAENLHTDTLAKIAEVLGVKVADLRQENSQSIAVDTIKNPGEVPGLNEQIVECLHGAALIRQHLDEAQMSLLRGELSADEFQKLLLALLSGLESVVADHDKTHRRAGYNTDAS